MPEKLEMGSRIKIRGTQITGVIEQTYYNGTMGIALTQAGSRFTVYPDECEEIDAKEQQSSVFQ